MRQQKTPRRVSYVRRVKKFVEKSFSYRRFLKGRGSITKTGRRRFKIVSYTKTVSVFVLKRVTYLVGPIPKKRPIFKKKSVPKLKPKKRYTGWRPTPKLKPRAVQKVRRMAAAPKGWVSLEQFKNFLKRRYHLDPKRSDEFQPWIEWVYMDKEFSGGSKFCWKSRAVPPYRGQGFYFTLSVWYVVRDQDSHKGPDEMLRVYRVKLPEQPDFDDIVTKDLPDAVSEIEHFLDGVDYLEFRGVVAWTATPVADWVKHAEARKKYYLKYLEEKERRRRSGNRTKFVFKDWKKIQPFHA